MKAISDERDVNQLSCHFTKQEEENFALFSYVNELSYEVEVLNETVQQFRNDIGKIRFFFFFKSYKLCKQNKLYILNKEKQKIDNEAKKQNKHNSKMDVLEDRLKSGEIKVR